tara:strand:- start:540 stop:731 length:192 start_codon:yes stop_codon:yes gene_type:complete
MFLMPFMAIAGAITAKLKKSQVGAAGGLGQEANLLAGDAINNYRTVASFANEEAIISKYEEII